MWHSQRWPLYSFEKVSNKLIKDLCVSSPSTGLICNMGSVIPAETNLCIERLPCSELPQIAISSNNLSGTNLDAASSPRLLYSSTMVSVTSAKPEFEMSFLKYTPTDI